MNVHSVGKLHHANERLMLYCSLYVHQWNWLVVFRLWVDECLWFYEDHHEDANVKAHGSVIWYNLVTKLWITINNDGLFIQQLN
jgi:hypothetical protein